MIVQNKLHVVFFVCVVVMFLYFTWQWRDVGVKVDVSEFKSPELPISIDRKYKDELEDMLAYNLFDQDRGRVEEKKILQEHVTMNTSWRLLATAVQQMDAPVASILTGDEVLYMHEGDVLPDGAYIAQVLDGALIIEQKGKEMRVYLFKK